MDSGPEHCTGGGDQNHPLEKEMQEGKVVVWGGLTKAEERSKWQGRKRKIYTQLNAEFQRRASREKEALREQYKETK